MVLCYSGCFLEAILGIIWDAFADANWTLIGMLIGMIIGMLIGTSIWMLIIVQNRDNF